MYGVLKFIGPVAVALAIGYNRFVVLENRGNDNRERILKLEAKQEAQDAIMLQNSARLAALELRQGVTEKTITESLTRIELMIKDTRGDVKELQQKKP